MALAQINGRRIPACVSIPFGDSMEEVGDERCLKALNVAIPLALGGIILSVSTWRCIRLGGMRRIEHNIEIEGYAFVMEGMIEVCPA
jgi:hypothetical protein